MTLGVIPDDRNLCAVCIRRAGAAPAALFCASGWQAMGTALRQLLAKFLSRSAAVARNEAKQSHCCAMRETASPSLRLRAAASALLRNLRRSPGPRRSRAESTKPPSGLPEAPSRPPFREVRRDGALPAHRASLHKPGGFSPGRAFARALNNEFTDPFGGGSRRPVPCGYSVAASGQPQSCGASC